MLVTAAEIAADRALVEEQMVDTCRIVRHEPNKSRGTWNETTGKYENADAGTTVYEGKFRLQVRSESEADTSVESGDHDWTFRRATAQLPIDGTTEIVTDCVLEVLTCVFDPGQVGRFYTLTADVAGKTLATHRRFAAQEGTS